VSDHETESSPYRAQVLDRATAIIDTLALAKDRENLSLMELAAKLQFPKSTAHRLLMILERHRMMEREPQSGRYRLGRGDAMDQDPGQRMGAQGNQRERHRPGLYGH